LKIPVRRLGGKPRRGALKARAAQGIAHASAAVGIDKQRWIYQKSLTIVQPSAPTVTFTIDVVDAGTGLEMVRRFDNQRTGISEARIFDLDWMFSL
jgi:hypothetical protein